MKKPPIFIVGTGRSGTTLLAAILSSHTNLFCGPETHFFLNLSSNTQKKIFNPRYWPDAAIKYICSLTLGSKKVYELYGLSLEDIYNYLSKNDPSIPSLLECLIGQKARKQGKQRWIEKTPRHILKLSLIREYFPDSPIIVCIRDIRDVALSMQKVPWASKSLYANAYRCDFFFTKSYKFIQNDLNTHVIKCEDLIQDPVSTLEHICTKIDEPFQAEMLSRYVEANHLMSNEEFWKERITKPIDKSRAYLWKRKLSRKAARSLSYIAYNFNKFFQYEIDTPPLHKVNAFPVNDFFLEKYEFIIDEFTDKKIRIDACRDIDDFFKIVFKKKRTEIVVFGFAGCEGFSLGFTSKQRILNTLIFCFGVLLRYFTVNPVFWFPIQQNIKVKNIHTGRAEILCNFFLKKLGQLIINPKDLLTISKII